MDLRRLMCGTFTELRFQSFGSEITRRICDGFDMPPILTPLALKVRGYTQERRDKTHHEVGGEIDCVERIAGILV